VGSKEVPIGAFYGIHTVRALENFKISSAKIRDAPEMVRGMVMVKKATAMANKDMYTIPADVADAIIAGCDEVLTEGRCIDQLPVDVVQGGAGTSVNMNTNEVIANLALEHMGLAKGRYDVVNPNEHVNESQSTNDAYPSGFRIALYTVVEGLKTEVENLPAAFDAKGDEFADVLKMGRTQLQDAIPMTLGQEFKVCGGLMREEVRALARAAELLLEINLGATAIGTGLNTPEGYAKHAVAKLAEVSGLPVVLAENLIEATSDAGAYVSMHGAVKRVAVKLGKVCNDLRLLSSGPRTGLNEINLPELQAGSSIMPAKVNTVLPEVVNQVCFKVIGNDVTVSMAAEAGQLQLNHKVLSASTFKSGMSASICVLGVAWMGTTFVSPHEKEIMSLSGDLLSNQPWLLAVVLVFASALLYSQAATTKALMPTALAIGVAPFAAVAAFPAVSAVFILPTYPTLLAAVQMDDTGTTQIGRAVFNHPFLIRGLSISRSPSDSGSCSDRSFSDRSFV
jgi:aspartate ammonia-lyase